MASNGIYNSASSWTLTTVTYAAGATATADGSGSLLIAASGRNTQSSGTATQAVTIAAGSSISAAGDITLMAQQAWTGASSTTQTVTIDLRYADASTVTIFDGTVGLNTPWTAITNNAVGFPLTLAQDVTEVIVTMTTKCGNNASATSDLWIDNLSIIYTAGAGDTTPPTDGAALTATPGDSQVDLSWDAASDDTAVDHYRLVFLTGSTPAVECTDGTEVYNGPLLTSLHGGLTNDTTYNYRLCAYDAAGNVSTGLTATATPTAAGVNTTAAGSASATPGNAVIDVTAPYTDDDNGNNTLLVEWGLDGVDCSLGSQPLAHAASPYIYQIPGLANGQPYQVCVTYQDGDGVTGTNPQTLTGLTPIATNPLLHNSINTASTKWGGDWGTATGKYGEFTCGTCHTRVKADRDYLDNGTVYNVKRLRAVIATPDSSAWASTTATTVDIQLTDTRTSPTGVGFGDDSGGHAVSARVCEGCHSQNKFHNYDTAQNVFNGGDLLHENNKDCIECHKHKNGFDASCTTCHPTYPEPPATGAHATHAGSSGYAYACTVCHPKDHDGDATDIVFSGIAAAWGTETYTAAGKTCSSLYCHGGATADWDGGTGGACGDCHGAAVTGRPDGASEPAGGSHLTTSHQVACTNCHSHDGSDKAEHVNGAADANGDALVSSAGTSVTSYTYGGTSHVSSPDPDGYAYTGGTCSNSCHADGDWGAVGGCTFCHGGSGLYYPQGAASPNTAGEHAAHIFALETKLGYTHGTTTDAEQQAMCAYCHNDGNGVGGADHNDGGTAEVGEFNPMWDGATADADGVMDVGDTCSNIDCHYNTTTADTWYGTGTAGCTYCHTGDVSYAAASLPNVHDTHVDETLDGGYDLSCVTCHSGAAGYADDHADGGSGSDVAFSGAVATAWGTETYTAAGKTCSSLYCHGGATADWDGGTGGTCGDCHGAAVTGRPDGASEPAGGSHLTTSHQVACTNCHSHDGSDKAEHVNGAADVNGDALVSGAGSSIAGYTYGVSAHVSSPDPDGYAYTGGTCATITCHGDNDADWGGTLGCTGCHGNPPATNAHLTHAGSGAGEYGYACSLCHPEDHDGDATDITFSGVAATWGTETYSAAGKTCSSLYCHGSATADWDGGSGGTCGDCHGAAVTGRPDGVDEPSGGSHLTGSHQVACTTCHSHDGTDTAEHANGPANVNGDGLVSSAGTSVTSYTYGTTLASAPDPDGYDYSGGTCANSCHGDSDWGGTASCTTCHNGGGSGATLVSVDSPHSTNTIAGSPTCESCHFANHGSRTTGTYGIVWSAQTMGTDYTVDGKIYIKSNGATTEAEACWSCHAQQTPTVSEWDGSSATYDYGSVDDGVGGVTVDDLNWFTTNWASANFSYKNGNLSTGMGAKGASTHGTNGGAQGVDQASEVSCTRCHDVHGIGNNGYTSGAAPYLRGSWKANPYREDGAPQSTTTYPVLGLYSGTSGEGVPRELPNDAAASMGGYWIDQNSGSPANGDYATHAGLCTLCHGDGDTIPAETADRTVIEGLFAGHSNSIAGGSGGGTSIFRTSRRNGDGTWNGGMWMGAVNSTRRDTVKDYAGSLRNEDYGDGAAPQVANNPRAWNAYAWGATVDDSATPQAGYHKFTCSKCHNPHASRLPRLMITNCLDVVQNSWDNQFTGDANWNNWTSATLDYGTKEFAYSSTAQNCHRYIDSNGDGDGLDANDEPGWNTVTPW